MSDYVWMAAPWGAGEPKKVEAKPEILGPMMVSGWSQCEPPAKDDEVTNDVHD